MLDMDIFADIPETNAALDFLLDGGEPFGIEPFDRLAKIGPHKGLGQDDLQTAKRDAARADIDANQFFDAGEAALGFGYLARSEEHTSELQSLMRISYAVFCLKKKTKQL